MKQDLYISSSRTELSDNEMQYINGGAVEVKRYGFLGLGVKL